MLNVLFVCTGNICRSPTAEGVFRHHVHKQGLEHMITVDSAGTHSYHVGEAPDSRSIDAARKKNISLDELRARKITAEDFNTFHLIMALDSGHEHLLHHMKPDGSLADCALFLPYAGITHTMEVPDPYYGDISGFTHVLELIEEGSQGLLERIQKEHLSWV